MNDSTDWKPSADLDVLQLRARLLASVRRFFDARGYWEVDTPLVSQERVIDAHLEPFVVAAGPDASGSAASPGLYLQTSPEFAMKRLLAAGAQAIYQLGHVFRAGEIGRLHSPEFTMVEWYRVGDTHDQQMQVVEELVFEVVAEARGSATGGEVGGPRPEPSRPFIRTTYREAFVRHAGIDVLRMTTDEIRGWVSGRRLHPPAGLSPEDRDDWLNWLLAELVEPRLGADRPEFLCDYPASQAALAKIRHEDPPVAERFELYWRGIELCNCYHELADAAELRQRIDAESHRRQGEGLSPLPAPRRLLQAMESGLPACTGVALGFDRLMMLAVGVDTIASVVPFTFDRA